MDFRPIEWQHTRIACPKQRGDATGVPGISLHHLPRSGCRTGNACRLVSDLLIPDE